jgi:transcriptional regulator with GAF, ATPase, and Fis domain
MDKALERADAITELQSILLSTSSIDELVDAIARSASARLAPRAEVTVTLRRQGRLAVVAHSGERARACDEVEYAADSGPCVEAVETGEIEVVRDLDTETRWPQWREAATRAGFQSAIAFPAAADEGAAVAVNVYSELPGDEWIEHALERGMLYAAEVARTVKLSLRVARAAEMSADLRAALASRAVIDQAIGVIMGQNRCTADEAFTILRSASQHRNIKLREVAATMIENVTGKPPAAPHEFVERTT